MKKIILSSVVILAKLDFFSFDFRNSRIHQENANKKTKKLENPQTKNSFKLLYLFWFKILLMLLEELNFIKNIILAKYLK